MIPLISGTKNSHVRRDIMFSDSCQGWEREKRIGI